MALLQATTVQGTLDVTGTITGNLSGNASTATSASFATNALTASRSTSASFASNSTSASYAPFVPTDVSSYLSSSITASTTAFWAGTASFASNVTPVDLSGYLSSSWTGSNSSQFAGSASFSTTASYVNPLYQMVQVTNYSGSGENAFRGVSFIPVTASSAIDTWEGPSNFYAAYDTNLSGTLRGEVGGARYYYEMGPFGQIASQSYTRVYGVRIGGNVQTLGTVTNIYSVLADQNFRASGSVTNAYGGYFSVQNIGGGYVRNLYGLYVNVANNSSGLLTSSIATASAVYIPAITDAKNAIGLKSAIWQVGTNDRVFFAGPVTASKISGSITGRVIGSASYASTSQSSSYALSASYAPPTTGILSGIIAGASFTGTPKTFDVTVSPPFTTTNYTVVLSGEDARIWTVESKSINSFTINSNSDESLTGEVSWQASGVQDTTTEKNGLVSGSAFTGSPLYYQVTLATPFANTIYSVVVSGEDARIWTVGSRDSGSFVIYSNSNESLTGMVSWQALQ